MYQFRFPLFVSLSCAAIAFATTFVSTAGAEDAVPKTISVFGTGTLTVPAAFKPAAKQSRIIEHEFQAKAGKGAEAKTARVTMMAAGGDVAANIKRWKGQFADGDPDKQKSEEMKLGDWTVHIVDLNGSYGERMGGGPFAGGKVVQRKDYAMAGAILVHPEGRKYFVKMIGHSSVIKENRKAFIEMIKSIEKN